MRLTRCDMRDHINCRKNDRWRSYRFYRALQRLKSPTCDICEIFEAPRFRSFSTQSAMKRREQVQRNCQCASTSRQKTHQAKADRAPRFPTMSDNRSSVVNLSRRIALAPRTRRRSRPHGAHRGGLGQVNSAGRDVAEYNLKRKRTSSTSSAGLPKRRAADTYPRHGRARPGHACLWTDILNPL